MGAQFADPPEPRGVARLLGVTLEDKHSPEGNADERIGELLRIHLEGVWSLENGREPIWVKLLKPLLRKHGPGAPSTVGGLLLDPHTAVTTIKAIRNHAKKRAACEDSEAEHAVMTTIYFAATASALVFHGVKVTTYSHESLKTSFEKLISKAWMPANLIGLFQRAVDICQHK